MPLDSQLSRLSKILVDAEGITFDEAQDTLKKRTLEVVVGSHNDSLAAHASILTAVSVASRSFVGGVRVSGFIDDRLNTNLPLAAETIGEAAYLVGTSEFPGTASRTVIVGEADPPTGWAVSPWWRDWRAGTTIPGGVASDAGVNPLTGIAAGAMSVGIAFEAELNRPIDRLLREVDLWPAGVGFEVPRFEDVFLPNGIWFIGLGNLGQSFLWALLALPYSVPSSVSLILQDHDTIKKENWATSVLVRDSDYGELKTRIAEGWASARGFNVRRIDRRLSERDRVQPGEPRLALSGVDKVEARRNMADVGFDCIIDGGLGRTAHNFDTYRVTVFDRDHRIDDHFNTQYESQTDLNFTDSDAYQQLMSEIGECGVIEVGGASVGTPYVSAVAGSIAIARAIAIASGCYFACNEVGKLARISDRKVAASICIEPRGIGHAGKPATSD